MEKTSYPAWKAELWMLGSFLYTIAAIFLSLFISLPLLSNLGDIGGWYAAGLFVLLLGGFAWLASRFRHTALPTIAMEVLTVAFAAVTWAWVYSILRGAYGSPLGGP